MVEAMASPSPQQPPSAMEVESTNTNDVKDANEEVISKQPDIISESTSAPTTTAIPPRPSSTRKKPRAKQPRYVQPAHFYPTYDVTRATTAQDIIEIPQGSDLLPEDDLVAARGIPVFKPSMEEFADFEAYMNRVDHWGRHSGIVKVIPPKEWTQSLPPIERRTLQDLRIKNPIQQNMMGRAGLFRQNNIEKNKTHPLSIEDWFHKCNLPAFRAPGPKDGDKAVGRDTEEAKAEQRKWREQKLAAVKAKREEREAKAAAKARAQAEAEAEAEVAPTASPEPSTPASNTSITLTHEDEAAAASSAAKPRGRPPKEKQALDPNRPLDPFFAEFEPSATWLPDGTKPEDWTPQACRDIERRFWKGVGIGEPSWYGADLQGTLFPDPKTPWNVAHLPNLLNRLSITKQLPGVNSPYLYFGMWRATFAWHVEDMDLFSINYIHFGAPKHWYAIPQAKSEAFERTIAGYFPSDAKLCDQFLRHKSFTVSPMRLANDNIKPNVLVQHQGEFVITYPRGYHAGFNMGFNCAESINFALDSWVELGRRAKVCECEEDSVRIDVEALIAENQLVDAIQQERADKAPVATPSKVANERTGSEFGSQRKRKPSKKALGEDDDTPPAKIRAVVNAVEVDRKPKVVQPAEVEVSRPCLFCPSLATEGLLPVYNPSAVASYSKSFTKQQGIYAHESCARAIPEIYMEDVRSGDRIVQCVMGAETIPKDRWNLKCSCCRGKNLASTGAKIQCTKGKCSRAFHVACAIADPTIAFKELEVETWEQLPQEPGAPEWAKPRCQLVKTIQVELLCSLHNPAVKDAKKRNAAEALHKEIMSLPMNSRVKVRASGGVFEVTLVQTMPLTQKVRVVWDDKREMELDWSQLDLKPVVERKPLTNEYERPKALSFRTKPTTASQPNAHPPATPASVDYPKPPTQHQQPPRQPQPRLHPQPTYHQPAPFPHHPYAGHHHAGPHAQHQSPYMSASQHGANGYSPAVHIHVHPPHQQYYQSPHPAPGPPSHHQNGHFAPMQAPYGYQSFAPIHTTHPVYASGPEQHYPSRPMHVPPPNGQPWPVQPQHQPLRPSYDPSQHVPRYPPMMTPVPTSMPQAPQPLGSSQIDFNKVLITPELHDMLGRNTLMKQALTEIKRSQGVNHT